jgi:hypothetical protein
MRAVHFFPVTRLSLGKGEGRVRVALRRLRPAREIQPLTSILSPASEGRADKTTSRELTLI